MTFIWVFIAVLLAGIVLMVAQPLIQGTVISPLDVWLTAMFQAIHAHFAARHSASVATHQKVALKPTPIVATATSTTSSADLQAAAGITAASGAKFAPGQGPLTTTTASTTTSATTPPVVV